LKLNIKIQVQIISAVVFVGSWQLIAMWIDNRVLFPSLTATIAAFWGLMSNAVFWGALKESAVVIFQGLAAAIIFGVFVGVLMGSWRIAEYALDPYVNTFYAMPRVALIPVIIVWFGLGVTARTAVVFLLAVFPILINTYYGIRNVSAEHDELARSYNAKTRHRLLDIAIPSALPFMLSGLRLSIGRAITGAVVAELLLSFAGLGGLLVERSNLLDTPDVYALAIVFAIIGVGLTQLGRQLERIGKRWRPADA
jgi:ABC-type nitrate/sulfonate/bicarbonate transport system permease component